MKAALRKWIISDWFPFAVYAVIMLVYHFLINVGWGDDSWFCQILGDGNASVDTWLNYLKSRYHGWTSRLVIEGVLVLIVHNKMLWRIADAVIMVWMAVALSVFFNKEKRVSVNWYIVCAMVSFPLKILSSAGWIATTLNYSWPLGMGFLAMIPIANDVHGKKSRRITYVLAVPALIYAVNQEQMCAVIFAISLFWTIWLSVRDKKIYKFVLFEALISFASLIFILTCPGNFERKELETLRFFPDFPELSFLRKAEMGYSSSLYEFIMKPNLVFLLFCIVMVAAVFCITKKALYRVFSVVSLAAVLSMGLFSDILVFVFPRIIGLRNRMTDVGTGIQLSEIRTWIPDLFITAVALCVLISIWGIYERKTEFIFPCYLLLLGLATHWIMGFSPTIWASDTRTFTFMYFSFIAAGTMIFRKIADKDSIKLTAGVFSAILVIQYLYFIITP